MVAQLYGARLVFALDDEAQITHVATKFDELEQIKNYSLKICYAMAKRMPVVSTKWIEACL